MSSNFNRIYLTEQNEDFQSLTSSLASSSFLNQNLSNYSPSCQCSISNESSSFNNSPLTPSVPQLAFTGLRSDLRPRNSSASSFSGSPVAKIEEEIDPIDDLGKTDMFFSIPSHVTSSRSDESSFLSSQSSAAVNTPPVLACTVDINKKLFVKPELCKSLFSSNHSKRNEVKLITAKHQNSDTVTSVTNSINYASIEHQSRPLNRSINTISSIQSDSAYEYNNTNVVYSSYYPSDYQRTRARSLK